MKQLFDFICSRWYNTDTVLSIPHKTKELIMTNCSPTKTVKIRRKQGQTLMGLAAEMKFRINQGFKVFVKTPKGHLFECTKETNVLDLATIL